MKMPHNFRISAVICELNPLHNGHFSLFEQLRKQNGGFLIAVMSGSFVQRGQPAVFDKWTRAKTALACGADLVVELPLPWSIARAETFAFGGVSLLHALGCVDVLGFGSECGDIGLLRQVAAALASPQFTQALSAIRQKNSGSPFATLRQAAVSSLLGSEAAAVLSHPNNTLGVAYCQAIEKLGASIRPVTVERRGAGYHQAEFRAEDPFPSATQLRACLQAEPDRDLSPCMPAACAAILRQAVAEGAGPVFPEGLEQAILAKLRTLSLAELEQLPDVSEGLERRLWQAARSAGSLEELFRSVKTKRYSHARIRRLVLAAFLGVTKDDAAQQIPYCRVLGMRRASAPLLALVKERSSIPLLTKYSDCRGLDDAGKHLFRLECRATDLYGLACPKVQPCGRDMTNGILVFP